MKNSTIRKNLVFAIILFFTVASVVPSISGNIVVGTFKLVKPYKILEGCEIWVRYG